jgi:hypothetical protein
MNKPKLGIIQVLSLGYESVLRAAWVLLIPVVLDLFFWLGPHLSVRMLVERLLAAIARNGPPSPEFQQNLADVQAFLSEVGSSLNLFALLATDFMGLHFLPVPSLKGFELTPVATPGAAPANPLLSLDDLVVAFVIALLLLALGLLIGAVYLNLIADRVRLATTPARPLLQRVLVHWLRLLAFVALLGLFYLIAGVPFLIAFGFASLIDVALGIVVLIVGWLLSFWLLLYLWFAAYAMIIDGVGVARAVWNSANVVQRNLLATFGLILLSNLIGSGMVVIWQLLEGSWYGDLLAIGGNAFIGSGLVAAAFVFYQDRLRAWQESAAQSKLSAPHRA